jgi:hypothetical protein
LSACRAEEFHSTHEKNGLESTSDEILALSQPSKKGDETKILSGMSWSQWGIEIIQYIPISSADSFPEHAMEIILSCWGG